MNATLLIGNVASEPQERTTQNGRTVCQFRVAVPRNNANDEADFFTVIAWEEQARFCIRNLSVGRRIGVEGRLHHSSWRTSDDQPRSSVEVIAQRIELLGGVKPKAASAAAAPASGDRELPRVDLTDGAGNHADEREPVLA